MSFEKRGVEKLAAAVLMQAVTDYKKMKASKKETRKLEGSWVRRSVIMEEIEKFFSDEGGADFYLEMSGLKVDAALILSKLKNV
jgi:hypothetical protein